jgi:hypothetical protein
LRLRTVHNHQIRARFVPGATGGQDKQATKNQKTKGTYWTPGNPSRWQETR